LSIFEQKHQLNKTSKLGSKNATQRSWDILQWRGYWARACKPEVLTQYHRDEGSGNDGTSNRREICFHTVETIKWRAILYQPGKQAMQDDKEKGNTGQITCKFLDNSASG
jgi:hypothetical protein